MTEHQMTERECIECHQQMPGGHTAHAQDDLYGAAGTLGSTERLTENIAHWLRVRATSSPEAQAVLTDDIILAHALTDWLGYNPVDLVHAVHHWESCPARE
jgi:hypothetical protein